jgi:hypothetical protein
MKKALSWLVVILMAASIFQVGFKTTPVKAAENKNATFIAVRFVPVGFERDGKELEGGKIFPWQKGSNTGWGNDDFPMPDVNSATFRVQGHDINVSAFFRSEVDRLSQIETTGTYHTTPLFWTDFYLEVKPAAGRSQVYEHWFAVYDNAGQLWLDPDGVFNDPRYFEPSDPTNLNGLYGYDRFTNTVPNFPKHVSSCSRNTLSRVDPSSANNTQGPYILDPENPRFSSLGQTTDESGNPVIYFWDRTRTQRIFRMGWADMPDFPLGYGDGRIPTEVQSQPLLHWDAEMSYPLIDFVYWGRPESINAQGQTQVATYQEQPLNQYFWYFSTPGVGTNPPPQAQYRVNQGDELHADNISDEGQQPDYRETVIEQAPVPQSVNFANRSPYDPGEYIYRKAIDTVNAGYNRLYWVQENDIRLTPVSVMLNGEVRNYPPNSLVKTTDWDCAYDAAGTSAFNPMVDSVNKQLWRFVVNFDKDGFRVPAVNDEVHVDNILRPNELGHQAHWFQYNYGEWIYRELTNPDPALATGTDYGRVTVGDHRLTNVNGIVNEKTLKKDKNRGQINAVVQMVPTSSMSNTLVPRVFADLFMLAEVLWGGCNQAPYNLSVQTDVWEGKIPSSTAARLHSPNDDIKPIAQSVQKSTVLDPTGSLFNIPATTFQNINLKYREYIGVEIWKDNGFDNNIGMNIGETPPSLDLLYPNNLSDDYREGRTGEEFLGASSYFYSEKDFGRTLMPFPSNVKFYDTDSNGYGCGETIYRDVDQNNEVSTGDIRLTDVTLTVGGNVIRYKAGSTVSAGDSDVTMPLSVFSATNLFFDKEWPEKDIPFNWTFDPGEDIYLMGDLDYAGPTGPQPAYRFYLGIKDPDTGVELYDTVLYVDIDNSGGPTPGDIRIVDFSSNPRYLPGSVISGRDFDGLSGWDFTQQAKILAIWDNVNNAFVGAYIDLNGNDILDMGDIRLNRYESRLPYKALVAGDPDLEANLPANLVVWQISNLFPQYVRLFDTTNRNVMLLTTDQTINAGDVWLTPYRIRTGDTRLTPVTISDVSYTCGSIIGTKPNFWLYDNPVHGLTMGKNSDFRYIDWEVFPSASLGMNVQVSSSFKVEQTSQIDVTVVPPPRDEYWENGKYFPAEKVYIMIRNVEGPGGLKLHETMKVITAQNPKATFQFTPYRGSCPSNGKSYGWKTDYVNGKYILKDYDLRVRIVAVKEDGGIKEPAPKTYYLDSKGNTKSLPIIDPFWRMHDNTNWRAGQAKGSVAWNPPAYNVPTFPEDIMNSFDCFDQKRYEVAPEDIRFVSNKKCIGILDQRFPNLTLKLIDADNPNDVNDPNGVAIAVPGGEETAAFYNATGAGIDYLFTGLLMEFDPEDPEKRTMIPTDQKAIIQVNADGTYLYWHWLDDGPHPGMFDSGDRLVSPNPKYTIGSSLPMDIPNYTEESRRGYYVDQDCSAASATCAIPGDAFKRQGAINYGDTFGTNMDAAFRINGEILPTFFMVTYGVPVYLMNYGERTGTDDGAEIQLAVAPQDAASKLKLQVYTYNVMYDYNSTIQHPPYFIIDENPAQAGLFDADLIRRANVPGSGLRRYETMGIDYNGMFEMKVLPPDPYVNFVEFNIIDHALQNSLINYTNGPNALSPLNVPTPQIQAPYNPLILDVGKDFRTYPGGQTHTGRIQGSVISSGTTRSNEHHNGWNAYPAVWYWYWYENVDYNNFTDFNKLGTEFFPLTDYGLYFILKDMDGKHLSLDRSTPAEYRLRRVRVKGPFARPKVYNEDNQAIVSGYEYNGLRNVPLSYDYSGELVIDSTNMEHYENSWGANWTNRNLDSSYDYVNPILQANRQMDYRGLENVFRVEELIPLSHGVITIEVTLWDGTLKIFQDCCAEPPTDGIDAHALEISTDMQEVTVDIDNKVTATIKEYSAFQSVQPVNDALVYVWQDRGVLNPRTKLYDGAGDGWLTNPPVSSDYSSLSPQFFREDDLNNDGKISFADFETEIIGTYDLATNTWAGGIIDARTFQRNNGQYVFDLSASNGAMITQAGLDFGGSEGDPDHVISDFEALPLMVTAYKYGDDNNDRSFRPLYNFGNNVPQYSHEVYLAGQKFIEVVPKMDLSVSVQPNPLTAGVTPELVDPVSPLTFVVTNDEGNPVDLSIGVPNERGIRTVKNEDIWNHLFKDPHPDPLPEYYWLRTDLHNDDGTKISNRRLYSTPTSPFQPISIDFTLAKDGKYAFRGFCANDEGNFDVFVYTADRKHVGKATVNVVLPTVEYSIVNTEDQAGTEFQVPGNPDFLLTAADNRIYRITVSVKNAQGILLKGITRGVSTCGGGIKNTARFTPYSTRPASFDFTERDRYLFAEHFLQDLYPYTLHVGFDFNDNGGIDHRNSELYSLGGFRHTARRDTHQRSLGTVYYNTKLYRYDDASVKEGWDIEPNPLLPPEGAGWGLGAIYNHPYRNGYLFSDIDGDGKLTFNDALGLDVNGQTTFYIFAEDLAYIGGLTGQNVYCNNMGEADLAGYPPLNRLDPMDITKRFHQPQSPGDYIMTPDGTFFLDWEAFPSKEVQIAAPDLKVFHASNRQELSKELLNANNYDLVYGLENHLIVEVRPADSRDVAMKEDGRVFLIGNQHQTAIYGHTKQSSDPKVMETTLHFTPTGLNEAIASLGYYNLNKSYLKEPYQLKNTSTYTVREIILLDAGKGLQVEIHTDGPLYVNKLNTITAKVTEIGTNAPVQGANVNIEGPGIKASKTTDKDGIATFDVTPNDKGVVKVVASKEGRIIGMAEIRVLTDTTAPWIELDPVHPITNRPQQEVSGRTNPGNTVTLNGGPAQVAQDGSFKGTVTLKEGLNTIVGEAKNAQGMTVRKMVNVTLDTTPPNIFIDDPGYLVDLTEVEITGRVETESKVTVNGQPAHVTHDIWKAKVKVNPGRNTINVEAVDQAGNRNTANREILVYKRTIIQLTLDNVVPVVNGEPQSPLEAPPFISGGRTMVPLRFIAEAFGAEVKYDAVTKGITITMGEMVIAMQIGSQTVLVNGKTHTIDAPPVIVNTRTFVPVRFVAEILGAKVDYDQATRTVTITRDLLP